MNARLVAEKNILKRKLEAERIADINVNKVLENEEIKIIFVKCKRLVVEIAKLEVVGQDASKQREEYNRGRELIAEALQAMGIDKSELKPKYTCAKCKDTGYIAGNECECLKREMSRILIESSGLDCNTMSRFEDSDFAIFDAPDKVKAMYQKMKKYIDDIDASAYDNVLIVGNTGVGKTHLMECMAMRALDNGKAIKYVTAFTFNQEMLKFHCARLEEKADIMNEYLKCDILFIDDLGTENKINNVTDEYFYSVINERMQNHRKTILTTNLDLGQIQDVYGERIFSRLMHKKQSLKINFVGSDLRIKK